MRVCTHVPWSIGGGERTTSGAFSFLVYLVFVSLAVPGAFRDSSVPPSHTAAGELGFHTHVTESGFTWVLRNLNAGPQACTTSPFPS